MYTQHQQNKHSEKGQVLMITTLFLLMGSMVVVGLIFALVRSQVRTLNELSFSKKAYILTEGLLEEVTYRHLHALDVSSTETVTEDGITVETTTTDVSGGKIILAVGEENNRVRKLKTELVEGDGVSFSFGIQTEDGGLIMENNSGVDGNVYSNGSVVGHNLNTVYGTVISSGPTGYVQEVHATGSVYAHTIEDSYIEENAYYTSIDIGTLVDGTKYPGATNQSTTSLPIPDSLIDSWTAYAESSSVLTAECTAAGGHIVYDTDVTLGPVKIPCDVTFEKNPEVTVEGAIWIEGNLTLTQGPEFTIDTAIGNRSIPIIVDNPSDRLTSGTIAMNNSGSWNGNGSRSYILLVSRNESAEQGGSVPGIDIQQSTGGDLIVYSNHGEISLSNSANLTEITAYRVRLKNNTTISYDTGLASAVFTTGATGSYTIFTWEEVE